VKKHYKHVITLIKPPIIYMERCR